MDGQEYFELMAALARARIELGEQPSKRALAQRLHVSPTTISKWLSGGSFPQRLDHVLALVAAVVPRPSGEDRLPRS